MRKLSLGPGTKKAVVLIKAIVSVIAVICIINVFYGDGLDAYYTEEVFDYQNNLTSEDASVIDLATPVRQEFQSSGQTLTNIKIYISELPDTEDILNAVLLDGDGTEIARTCISTTELSSGEWNTIGMNADGLNKGSTYILEIYTDGDTGVLSVVSENTEEGFVSCYVNNEQISGCLCIGIHQVYRHIGLQYAFYLGMNVLLVTMLLALVLYTIFNIEKCINAAKTHKFKNCWLYAIVISVSGMFLFNPMDSANTRIESFSRVIGLGLTSGYDVTKTIQNFYSWFLAFGFLMGATLLFFSYVRNKEYTKQENEAWKFLDGFMVLALVNLVLRGITFFASASSSDVVFYFSSYIISFVILCTLIYIIGRISRWMDFSSYFSAFVAAFSLGYSAIILVKSGWEGGRLLVGVLGILALLLIAAIMRRKADIPHRKAALSIGVIAFSAFPLLLSLCIEFIYILAGYGVYIISLTQCCVLAILIDFAMCICFVKKKKDCPTETIAFPLLIFGIAALSVQVPLTATYTADVFEGANKGILITDFLNFGDIPLISHYGGHMMTGVWEGILYGLINQDYVGAAFSPYSVYITPVIAVLFYFLTKKVCGDKEALLIALLFPFYNSISTYGQGIFIILAVIAFVKKNSYGRALLVWLACIWCTLYRLDMGYAFDIACIVTLICYIVVKINWKAIKPLLVTLGGCAAIGLTAWTLLCIRADVNPISRLLEFLEISASNQNWAYNNIGDSSKTVYFWCYLFMPLLVEGSLLYAIFSKNFREKAGILWYVLLVLGISYFANFSRGLVRHSLVEMSLSIILWTASLYLAVFASVKLGRKVFLPVFAVLILTTQLFNSGTNFSTASLADTAITQISSNLKAMDSDLAQAKEEGQAVQRVVVSETLVEHFEPLEYLVDILLEEDETYVDFVNHTLSYSYLQKENPVYVSQSPLQLSGEYTQEQFVSEISYDIDSNPIVILPYDNSNCKASSFLDGVANVVRNYKVAEFIYQNYVPLCYYGEYAIWCLPDEYEEMLAKLDIQEEMECIDTLKENVQMFNLYNMDAEADSTGITFTSTDTDPQMVNFSDYLDLTHFVGKSVRIVIEYESDVDGRMQLFYTENSGEGFTEKKSVSVTLSSDGGAVELTVPITEYTKMRLDIPDQSQVKLTSIKLCSPIGLIDYGYDRFETNDTDTHYIDTSNSLHVYDVNQLARIWGELDTENAAGNALAASVSKLQSGWYSIQNATGIDKTDGNYLLINATYYGTDAVGYTAEDDERTTATIRLGVVENGTFVEKYHFVITVMEGTHQYLLRISCDYFWYAEEIDTIMLDCSKSLVGISMDILCGD